MKSKTIRLLIVNITAALGLLAFAAAALPKLTTPVEAAVRCEFQYGVGEVCVKTGELQIDKKVWHPADGAFVDNLTLTSYIFNVGEEIVFKLTVKNVGDEAFDKVTVTDTLPSFLEHLSGDLSFEINNLGVGESREYEIRARVKPDQFSADKLTLCDVNTARVESGDQGDKDTSQVCAEKKVLGVAVLPAAGPSDWIPAALFSVISGLLGLTFLTRSARLRKISA